MYERAHTISSHGARIYSETKLEKVKGRRLVLQFDVERVKIHDYGPGDPRCKDPLCARNLDVSHFLNLHSKTEHDDFCLAYVFTHREDCSQSLTTDSSDRPMLKC